MMFGIFRIQAQRQRRRAIGDQVDPQQLRCQQRQEEAALVRVHQPQHAGQHHPQEHRQQLASVAREQVIQILADIIEDAAPLFDRLHNTGEVIVGEHHVGGLFRDIGAGDAHRDPDIGGLERRRIVDAVAGHRHDLAAALEALDDPQLVFGIDPRIHLNLVDNAIELGVADCRQIGPAQHAPARRR